MKQKKEKQKPVRNFDGHLKAYKTSSNAIFVEGFANAATVDRSKELIDPKAFTVSKGLDNFMKNPTMLFDHGLHPDIGGLPIGKFTEVTATDKGLFVKGKLSQSKDPPISTIRTLVEEGNLRAFSVGFNPEEVDGPDEKGVSTIKSAELFEISIVGIPMNQDSLFNVATKGGRKVLTKSYNKIVADICKAKGAKFAELVNLRIDEMLSSDDENDRSKIVGAIAEKAGVSEATVLDVLSGALSDIPNQLMDAFSDVLGDDVKAFGKPKEEDDEEDEEDKDEKTADIAVEDDDEDEDEEEKAVDQDRKDFQDCVNEKIPKLIEEGKEQDEAVATAIAMCRESQKCAIEPDKDMFISFQETIDKSLKQQEDGETEDVVITEPIRTTTPDSELGTSPMLDQTKQTNVLLGSIANDFKLFSESFTGMRDDIVNAINQLSGKTNSDDAGKNDTDEVKIESTSDSEETKRRVERVKKHIESMASRLEKLGVSFNSEEL